MTSNKPEYICSIELDGILYYGIGTMDHNNMVMAISIPAIYLNDKLLVACGLDTDEYRQLDRTTYGINVFPPLTIGQYDIVYRMSEIDRKLSISASMKLHQYYQKEGMNDE